MWMSTFARRHGTRLDVAFSSTSGADSRTNGDLGMGTIMLKALAGGGGLPCRARSRQYMKYTTPASVFCHRSFRAGQRGRGGWRRYEVLKAEPQRVERLRKRSEIFLRLAKERGLDTGPSGGTPIVPVVVGDSMRSLAASSALRRRGIDAQPILYPAVPGEQKPAAVSSLPRKHCRRNSWCKRLKPRRTLLRRLSTRFIESLA